VQCEVDTHGSLGAVCSPCWTLQALLHVLLTFLPPDFMPVCAYVCVCTRQVHMWVCHTALVQCDIDLLSFPSLDKTRVADTRVGWQDISCMWLAAACLTDDSIWCQWDLGGQTTNHSKGL
jgi:hypothetical protein